jgi:transcriptional regulator with XRE-family HTH domain
MLRCEVPSYNRSYRVSNNATPPRGESTLGGRILLCRLALGQNANPAGKMTQANLAEAVTGRLSDRGFDFPPFSKVTVSRWESGKTEPSLAALAAIAEVFGCDPAWLAFGEGQGRQSPLPSWVNSVHPSVLLVMRVAVDSRPDDWTDAPQTPKPLPRKRPVNSPKVTELLDKGSSKAKK